MRKTKLSQYPDILSLSEVAEILHVAGISSVRRLIKNGKIKALKPGKNTIIPKKYLEEYIYGKEES